MASSRRSRCCAPPSPEHVRDAMTEEMTRYYARRAGEYERVYTLPAWQPGNTTTWDGSGSPPGRSRDGTSDRPVSRCLDADPRPGLRAVPHQQRGGGAPGD